MDPYYPLCTESCDDTSYKPLQFFITQSMPIPETTVLPSGVEVPSYCCSVLKGDMQLIEKARSEKKDINVTSNNTPRYLLHYGVLAEVPEEERYRNLKKLVDLGADREQRDEHGRTPLHLAVLLGDTKAVDVLLETGCDITAKCHGNNLMHLATISGDPDMFHKVREVGFDPQELTEYGFTSVHLAACYNHHQMIPLLKRCGVDVNQRNEIVAGTSPFNRAIMPVGGPYYLLYALKDLQGRARTLVEMRITYAFSDLTTFQNEFLHSLIRHNSNVAENKPIGDPPLFVATHLGFVQCVVALVNNGADPLCVDSKGESLLHLASIMGHLELVKYLFEQRKSRGISIEESTIMSALILGAANTVEFLVEISSANFVLCIPDSPFSPMSLVDFAALVNQPEILQFALTTECKSHTNRPREANYLLVFSIFGSWFLNILSKAAPVFQVTEERQRAVLSAILDMPGCNPMDIMPITNVRAVDIAVVFHQSTALSVILDHVKMPKFLSYYPTSPILSLPMLHLCVYSSVWLQQWLRTDEELNILSLVDPNVDEIHNTCDVLLKHGYDINVVDFNGATCLDYAMQVAEPVMESYLRSRGALTGEQLKAEIHKLELAENMARLKDDKMKLVEEKKGLMVENQKLRLQKEDLSKKMDLVLKQLSPLFSFFNPGSSPSTQPVATPSPSVTNPSPAVIVSTQLSTLPVTTLSPSVPVGMMSPPVPDTTPTDPRLTTPTIHQLNQIIIRQVAVDWYSVGLHLEIDVPTLKIIEADVYPPSVEKCCRTMFTRWLSHDEGTGGAPRLWRTVLKALKDVGYNTLVEDVERELFEQNQ